MSRRADVVHGTKPSPEPGSDIGPVSKGHSTMTAWSLTDSLTLGALPTAVPSARAHARMMMVEWSMPGVAEDVALVVSELVTNAVAASTDATGRPRYAEPGGGLPVVYLCLRSDHERILVDVWDSNREEPLARQPEIDEESGRGLLLVEALCERWACERMPGWPGKVVWAELRAGSI
jgi:anti-sigma regulatory factor (Ser/Thr protein kinase)